MTFAFLTLLGLVGGAFANYLIYSWAYFPRHISPWAPPHSDAPPRRGFDLVPVLGWFGLRRERTLHGSGFWIRPLLVEIGCAAAFPLLYWYYTQSGGLLPPMHRNPPDIAAFASWGQSLFAVHIVLFVLMVAATFIDFDEQSIPDIITLPGTLLALVFSVMPWWSFLPAQVYWSESAVEMMFYVPWPPNPAWLGGRGLLTALVIWWLWIFALLDRRLILRRGMRRAVDYFVHGIRRREASKPLFYLGVVGSIFVLGVWMLVPAARPGLLSALIGLAVGGGTVWSVRIVAGYAMRQEAMGFGDVTLMAMIGAFLGWQPALAGFFLAPPAAIVIVLIQFLVTRRPAVPFGPYLCAGTSLAVLFWHVVWNETLSDYVLLGPILFWVLFAALAAMGVMLIVWRQIKRALFRP